MTRAIIFDTETTGLEPELGHRLIEIAALELMNDLPTGRAFHRLIDPCRDIPADATRIHGFTNVHLTGKPPFAQVAADLLAFFGEQDALIAHNAAFDFAFLNAELALAGLAPLPSARMIDTLALAKTRFPGLPNSLDALCRRFEIDLSARTTHNALLDCKLLAEVYVELTGGRQRGLSLEIRAAAGIAVEYRLDAARVPRLIEPTEAERAAHAAFVARLKEPLWLSGSFLPG